MKKAIRKLIVGLVMGHVLVGCDMHKDNTANNNREDAAAGMDGDMDAGMDDEQPVPVSADKLCEKIAESLCVVDMGCCRNEEIRFDSMEECMEEGLENCNKDFAPLLEDNRIHYDEKAAGELVTAIKSFSDTCNTSETVFRDIGIFNNGDQRILSDNLSRVFNGTVKAGGDCSPATDDIYVQRLFVCISGVQCYRDYSGEGYRDTCMMPVKVNGDCSSAPCKYGLYCDDIDLEYVCRQMKDDGVSCHGAEQCKSGGCGPLDTSEYKCKSRDTDVIFCVREPWEPEQ